MQTKEELLAQYGFYPVTQGDLNIYKLKGNPIGYEQKTFAGPQEHCIVAYITTQTVLELSYEQLQQAIKTTIREVDRAVQQAYDIYFSYIQ